MTGPKPSPSYWLTRFCFQKAQGFVYFIAFFSTALQYKSLIGEKGLLPMGLFLSRVRFWDSPTLFHWNSSDLFVGAVAWTGVALSLLAVTGLSERFGLAVSTAVWASLWLLYLSVVNAGQTFYSFGWESMTLECGFLAIFLGSNGTRASAIGAWGLRWILFRLMFGAGLIKLRGDACWLDLTCMNYHYETQPIPNPLSWYFHHLPETYLKFQTLYTHFMELVVPWFYFFTGPVGWTAGVLTVVFQGCLIASGNLSWLNYITIAVAIGCFDDRFLGKFVRVRVPETPPHGRLRRASLYGFAGLVLVLSVQPAVNLFSSRQLMNASFEPLHLVNTYGAFGSITKVRNEIVLEGSDDLNEWKEYAFKAKPGDVHRTPPVVSPYHRRLDWLMWFAAMGSWRNYPWTLNLVNKLLRNDPEILRQIEKNPFGDRAPRYIRARFYRYRFTTLEEKKKTGDWWVREPLGLWLPAVSLDNEAFRMLLRRMGWD